APAAPPATVQPQRLWPPPAAAPASPPATVPPQRLWPAPASAPASPPATVPSQRLWPPPAGAQQAPPPPADAPSHHSWGGVPIQPRAEGADDAVRGNPNTEPEPRD